MSVQEVELILLQIFRMTTLFHSYTIHHWLQVMANYMSLLASRYYVSSFLQ